MKKNSGRLLFSVAYFAYASLYIARLNLTVASPIMQETKLMSASQIGLMGGIFFLFYSVGQLLNGYLGDIFPPKRMVMTGLLLTAVSNLTIGLLPDIRVIILLWGINGFAQSMLWGPLLRSISEYFPPHRKSFIASFLVSSVGVGSIIGVFLATAAIHYESVRNAFFWPGLISLLAFFIVLVLFSSPQPENICQKKKPLTALFTPSFLLLLTAAMFHGVLKDNINLWAASYFMEVFSVDLVTMSFYVFAIPFLGLIGRLLYLPLYRLLGENEHRVSIFTLTLASCSLIPLCFPEIPMVLAALCLGIAAAAISLVNTSFLTIFPMRYQSTGCVSKVVGLMDFATYLGAGISSFLYGIWLESHTYLGMFLSWILLSLFAVLLLTIVQKRRFNYE